MSGETARCTATKPAKYGGDPYACHLSEGHDGPHRDVLWNPLNNRPAFTTEWSEPDAPVGVRAALGKDTGRDCRGVQRAEEKQP